MAASKPAGSSLPGRNSENLDFFALPKDPEKDRRLLKESGLFFEEDHLSHAFLLAGTEERVRQLSQALIRRILLDFGKADPQNFSLGACPDLVLERGEKIPIDRVRELKNQVFRIPIESKYKVFYLEKAGEMLAPAQNALLKSLEEPPSYLVWILGTQNRSKLLPTIQSRCRILALGRGAGVNEAPIFEDSAFFQDPAFLSLIEDALAGRGEEVFLQKDPWDAWKEKKEEFFSLWLFYLQALLEKSLQGSLSREETLPPSWKRSMEKITGRLSPAEIGMAIEETEKIRQLLAVNINFQFAVEGLVLRLSRLNR